MEPSEMILMAPWRIQSSPKPVRMPPSSAAECPSGEPLDDIEITRRGKNRACRANCKLRMLDAEPFAMQVVVTPSKCSAGPPSGLPPPPPAANARECGGSPIRRSLRAAVGFSGCRIFANASAARLRGRARDVRQGQRFAIA